MNFIWILNVTYAFGGFFADQGQTWWTDAQTWWTSDNE